MATTHKQTTRKELLLSLSPILSFSLPSPPLSPILSFSLLSLPFSLPLSSLPLSLSFSLFLSPLSPILSFPSRKRIDVLLHECGHLCMRTVCVCVCICLHSLC